MIHANSLKPSRLDMQNCSNNDYHYKYKRNRDCRAYNYPYIINRFYIRFCPRHTISYPKIVSQI